MDIHSIIVYAMGHATPSNLSTARSTETSSRSAAAGWQDVSSVAATLNASISSRGALGPGLSPKWGSGPGAKPTPGRPPRLSKSQKRRLLQLLEHGAGATGYRQSYGLCHELPS